MTRNSTAKPVGAKTTQAITAAWQPPLRQRHRLLHRDVDNQRPGAKLMHRHHRGLRD